MPEKIFTERIEDAAPAHARRTVRLESLVHSLSIAISNDTLLRIVRRRGVERAPAPSAIGMTGRGAVITATAR